jgi:hypothetical protein
MVGAGKVNFLLVHSFAERSREGRPSLPCLMAQVSMVLTNGLTLVEDLRVERTGAGSIPRLGRRPSCLLRHADVSEERRGV